MAENTQQYPFVEIDVIGYFKGHLHSMITTVTISL